VGHLIFVEDPSLTLDDHARLMHGRIQELRLPTWIIGPPPGPGEPADQDAEILKVYPARHSKRTPSSVTQLVAALAALGLYGGTNTPGRARRRLRRRTW
jgi:hypothetical protein